MFLASSCLILAHRATLWNPAQAAAMMTRPMHLGHKLYQLSNWGILTLYISLCCNFTFLSFSFKCYVVTALCSRSN